MNYCRDCKDFLIHSIEWRYGYCLYCLVIRLEKLDESLTELWWEGFDDAI
jgi:hypothetical protein